MRFRLVPRSMTLDDLELKNNPFSSFRRQYLANAHPTIRVADRTATQYDRLLASSCCPSVCLSVMLCIVALGVGVHG